jgi:hypothetical protein
MPLLGTVVAIDSAGNSNPRHDPNRRASMSPIKFTTGAIAAAAFLAACSDSSGPASAGRQVSLQLATQPAGPAPAPGMASIAGEEVLAAGGDTIVVTGVQLVLREIELKRTGGLACDTALVDDDCEELELGPVLLDLPLGAGAQRQFTVAIDTGSYDKIEFEIHKPTLGDDPAFVAANPTFDGVSIVMTGTFNGTPFSYASDLDVEQEYAFNPSLIVTETSGANVTLFVDLHSWFLNQTADGFIDPATANKGGQNEGEVKSNIETSLNAFEDDDHDGEDDHGGN